MESNNYCVQVCDQTQPTTPPPLNTWCLLVSNANGMNSVYVSVEIQLSAPVTSTSTSSATSSSTSSASASASASASTAGSAITTVVVTVPTSSASKMSEQSSIIFFFGLVWFIWKFNVI